MPSGNYKTTAAIVLSSSSPAQGQTWYGEGSQRSVIVPTGAGVDGIQITGTNFIGNLRDFGIVGASNTGRGIYSPLTTLIYDSSWSNMGIDMGGNAVDIRSHFSHDLTNFVASSHTGHGFCIAGGNTVLLNRCYASQIRAPRKAGYRIQGDALLLRCNGVDTPAGGSEYWGIFGGYGPVNGTCQAGSTSTVVKLSAGDPGGPNEYELKSITFTGGTGSGQVGYITSHNFSAKTVTLATALGTVPDATSTYTIGDPDFGAISYSTVHMLRCNIDGCTFLGRASTAIACHIHLFNGNAAAGFEGQIKNCDFLLKSGGSRTYAQDIVCDWNPADLRLTNMPTNAYYVRDVAATRRMLMDDSRGIYMPSTITTSDPADGSQKLWMDTTAGRVLKVGT
jgi:hypothetical protein